VLFRSDLIKTAPSNVICVPFGWDEETETNRNRIINDLNISVSVLPCVVVYGTQITYDFNNNPIVIGPYWYPMHFDHESKPWKWEQVGLVSQEPRTEPVVEVVEPVVEAVVEPVVEVVEPVVEVVEPVVEAVVEPVVEVLEPVVEVLEPVVEAVVEPVVEALPVVEPVVEAVVEPVVEPVVEAVVEQVIEETV
jgi:hypothetical protein